MGKHPEEDKAVNEHCPRYQGGKWVAKEFFKVTPQRLFRGADRSKTAEEYFRFILERYYKPFQVESSQVKEKLFSEIRVLEQKDATGQTGRSVRPERDNVNDGERLCDELSP